MASEDRPSLCSSYSPSNARVVRLDELSESDVPGSVTDSFTLCKDSNGGLHERRHLRESGSNALNGPLNGHSGDLILALQAGRTKDLERIETLFLRHESDIESRLLRHEERIISALQKEIAEQLRPNVYTPPKGQHPQEQMYLGSQFVGHKQEPRVPLTQCSVSDAQPSANDQCGSVGRRTSVIQPCANDQSASSSVRTETISPPKSPAPLLWKRNSSKSLADAPPVLDPNVRLKRLSQTSNTNIQSRKSSAHTATPLWNVDGPSSSLQALSQVDCAAAPATVSNSISQEGTFSHSISQGGSISSTSTSDSTSMIGPRAAGSVGPERFVTLCDAEKQAAVTSQRSSCESIERMVHLDSLRSSCSSEDRSRMDHMNTTRHTARGSLTGLDENSDGDSDDEPTSRIGGSIFNRPSRRTFGVLDNLNSMMEAIPDFGTLSTELDGGEEMKNLAEVLREDGAQQESSLQKMVKSRRFELGVAWLIIFNAAVIGAQTDWSVKNIADEQPLHFRVFEVFFVIAFTAELFVRMVAEGWAFWSCSNKDIKWNIFDSVLVFAALGEEITLLVTSSNAGGPDMSAMRVLRVARLVRVIRVVRVLKFFRDLRVMVTGIMNSLKSLMWCLLLLLIMMFAFGVCVMQVATEELVIMKTDPDYVAQIDENVVLFHFGSLLRTIYTLFCTISSGVDWGDVSEPLISIHPLMGMLFVMYIAFGVLCVLNIVTGVFVENANKLTRFDEDDAIMEELGARRQWFEEIQHIFKNSDTNDDGSLDWEEFKVCLKDPRIQKYLSRLGLNMESQSVYGLFQLLDFDGDGSVDADEFVSGCAHLHGNARSLDIARMRHDMKEIRRQLRDLASSLIPVFEGLEQLPSNPPQSDALQLSKPQVSTMPSEPTSQFTEEACNGRFAGPRSHHFLLDSVDNGDSSISQKTNQHGRDVAVPPHLPAAPDNGWMPTQRPATPDGLPIFTRPPITRSSDISDWSDSESV